MKNIDFTKYSLEDLDRLETLANEPTSEKPKEHFMDRFKKFKEPIKEYIARPIARAAKSAGVGTGYVADVAASPFKAALGLAGIESPSASEEIGKAYDYLTNGMTIPRNQLERNVDTATEAVASLPIGGPEAKVLAHMGKFKTAGKTAQAMLAGQKPTMKAMTGAAAAGATGRHLADNPLDIENPLLRSAADLASSVGANVATQSAAHMLSPKTMIKGAKAIPKGIANKIAKYGELDPGAIEAARLAGIELTPADVLKSKQAKRQQNILGRMPFVGGKIQKAMDKRYQTALESLNQDKGELLTKERGAELAQKGTASLDKSYTDHFNKEYGNIEKRVEKYRTTGKDKVNPSHALSYIDKLRNKLSSKAAREDFDKTELGQYRKKLQEYGSGKKGRIAFNDLVELRKSADNATNTHGIHGPEDKGRLKQLSARINQDLDTHLKDIDPAIYKDWKDVNKKYSQYKNKTLPAINKVMSLTKEGKDIDALMSVMPTKSGGKALNKVLKALPEKAEKEELFNIVLRTAGTDNKGNFSLVRAYNYINNLTPMTKNQLLHASGKNPGEIKKFKAVMETINNTWKTSLEENPSQSGSHLIQHGMGLSIMSSIASGNWLGAAKQIGAVGIATVGTGAALKDQRLINLMYEGYKDSKMTEKDFNAWTNKISKADPHFKKVIQSTLKSSSVENAAVTSAKQHAAIEPETVAEEEKEETTPDFNSMSLEELERLEALAQE